MKAKSTGKFVGVEDPKSSILPRAANDLPIDLVLGTGHLI
jgi:hypothetical protein